MIRDNHPSDLVELVESLDSNQQTLAVQLLQIIQSAEKARLESERIFNAILMVIF
jgi:hypothetical protein